MKKVAQHFVIMVAHPAYPEVARWGAQFSRPAGSAASNNNRYVFFDCNGSELNKHRKNDGCSTSHLSATMAAILKERGKGVSFSDYRKVAPEFEKANRMLEIGAYSAAYKIYEKLSKKKYKPAPPMVQASREKLKEITEKVSELFREIKEKIEQGQKTEALVELRILRARAGRLKIGTELMKETKKLEKDDAITAEDKKKAGLEAKACELYLRAEGYAADGNVKSAKNFFERVAEVYDETSFAETAKQRFEEMSLK